MANCLKYTILAYPNDVTSEHVRYEARSSASPPSTLATELDLRPYLRVRSLRSSASPSSTLATRLELRPRLQPEYCEKNILEMDLDLPSEGLQNEMTEEFYPEEIPDDMAEDQNLPIG
uniref:Uncharacterized protein n=1 Tax=Acrobeloides nanus TaxID=290746 RepID=A0A914CUT1_9BILA